MSAAFVGKSSKLDSFQAGCEAAKKAVLGLGGERPSLVLVFATTGHVQEELLRGVREITGGAPLSGCSATGVISREGADESSHAVGVLAIASKRVAFTPICVRNASDDPRSAATELAAAVQKEGPDDARALLLFPDGLRVDCGALLSTLDTLLPGVLACVGGAAGCILTSDVHNQQTFQYHQGEVLQGAVTAVLVSGGVRPEIAVSHGCLPIGIEQTVTRAEGPLVFEIDGRRAFDVLKDYLDDDTDQLGSMDIVHLCVGVPLPVEHQEDYGTYVIRTPLANDKETGSLFFANGIAEGTQIQMTRREPNRIREAGSAAAARLAARQPGRKPLFTLQFDCAGRGQMLFGDEVAKYTVDPLRQHFADDVAWLGFHTYGEIAPLKGKTYFHNYSVALCAFYETE